MAKNQNSKQRFGIWKIRILNLFRISNLEFRIFEKRGVALVLSVIISSAIFSISLGVFSVLFGQLLISGESGDSELALYASDQGIERALYRDRVSPPTPDGLCSPLPPTNICSAAESATLPSGACYAMLISKTGGAATTTTLTVDGQYRCGSSTRVVKRRFQVNY